MSALGQKQTCAAHKVMSALPSKADMCSAQTYVRFVPKAVIEGVNRKTASRRSPQNSFCIGHAASAAFLFLRHPRKPNTPRPLTKSGSAPGTGVGEMVVRISCVFPSGAPTSSTDELAKTVRCVNCPSGTPSRSPPKANSPPSPLVNAANAAAFNETSTNVPPLAAEMLTLPANVPLTKPL